MAYEILDHTADAGVRGIGKTVEEAFCEAARGMFSLMVDLERVEPKEAMKVEVRWTGVLSVRGQNRGRG